MYKQAEPNIFFLPTYHFKAMVTGVVRQDVKRSAGKSGFMGKICVELHAANWIQELKGGRGGTSLGDLLLLTIS